MATTPKIRPGIIELGVAPIGETGRVYYPEAWAVLKPILETHGVTRTPYVIQVTPMSFSIKRNSYRQADSFSISVDAKTLPISPQMIRAMSAEIYLTDRDTLLAALGQKSTNLDASGQTPTEAIELRPVAVGVVDDVEVSYSDSGYELTIHGQDYTALFVEHVFGAKRNFSGKRLDTALTDLMREVDLVGNMRFVNETGIADAKLPVIGKSASRTNKNGFPVEPGKTNYWEMMYDLALKHGFILFVRDLEIVLATPTALQEATNRSARRQYSLSWGRNVSEFSISRKMGKEMVPQFEVISYDERTRKPIVGRYPEEKTKVTTGVGTKRNEVSTYVLEGVRDPEILKRLAQTLYELIAQSEQTISLTTHELADSDNKNLLYIKAGDGIKFSVRSFNGDTSSEAFEAGYAAYLQKTLTDISPETAVEMAKTKSLTEAFKGPLYVREASIDWDASGGFSLSLECVGFVTIGGQAEKGDVEGEAAEVGTK